MKIHDLHPSIRPFEKAKEHGVESLSDIELLALIIRSGTQKNSALAIAQIMLNECGGMQGFCSLTDDRLRAIDGISHVKAQQIMAILELMTRVNKPRILETLTLDSLDKVIAWLNLKIGYRTQECLLAIYLSHHLQYLNYRILFTGTINQSNVYPREIIKEALLSNASQVILVHNHPSGVLKPSNEDLRMTGMVYEALALCELTLLDHIIVSKGSFLSIRKAHAYLFE